MQLQYWNGKVVSNYESCSESDFEDVQLSRVRQKVGMMALLSAKHCTNYCQTINLQSN